MTTRSGRIESTSTPSNDRRNTNSLEVLNHYSFIREENRAERNKSRIYHLRSFNNWVKNVLINKSVRMMPKNWPVLVVDVGCGKGGDVSKWKRCNASKINFVDLCQAAVDECRKRFSSIRNTDWESVFQVLNMNKDQRNQFECEHYTLVSCQFMVHYTFESCDSVKTFMANVSHCLKPGGFFFGTTTDCFELVRRWQESGNNKFGNDIYTVDFQNLTFPPPLFGAKIYFKLHNLINCPEYLLYFPAFVKIAESYGLDLIYHKNFKDFFDEHSNNRQMLSRMEALESYPASPGTSLVGPERSYEEARRLRRKMRRQDMIVGTISKEEWEVATIYVAFIFRKKPNM